MQVCLLLQNERGVRLIYLILVTRTEDFLIVGIECYETIIVI